MEDANNVRAPVALLLGAGASEPLGMPCMGEFVTRLKSQQRFSLDSLFNRIIDKKPDLEFLLEELQELEGKDYITKPGPLGLIGGPPENTAETLSHYALAAAALRRDIERQVFLTYRSPLGGPQVSSQLSPLFDTVAKFLPQGDPLLVFTTNYDSAVETLTSQPGNRLTLVDGFAYDPVVGQAVWSPEAFERSDAEGPNRRVLLFKLHGSTTWHRDGGSIVKGLPIHSGGDARYHNALIYPGLRKVASEEPFFTCYEHLQAVAAHVKCLVSVGYSFRDLDMTMRLASAARQNRDLKIVTVSPLASGVATQLRERGLAAVPVNFPYRGDRGPRLPSASPSPLDRIRTEIEKALE